MAMRACSTTPQPIERRVVRGALAIAALGLSTAVSGCSSTEAFDAPFADYTQRTVMVATTGGNSLAANTTLQTATPWPSYANDTKIPADGARLAKAVQRYESGASDNGAQASPGVAAGSGSGSGASGYGASTGMGSSPPAAAVPAQQ